MNLVRRLFPFRTCTIDIKDGERALQRPCLLYHIKRCQGPCIEAISKDEYRADIEQVELFLEGRQESLVRALRDDMKRASDRQDYEHAAITRDKIKAIERTMESQKMAAFARTDLDLLGLARRDNQAAVQLFVIRGGKALGRDVFLLDTPRGATDAEVVSGLPAPVLRPGHERPAGDRDPAGPAGRARISSGSSPIAGAAGDDRRAAADAPTNRVENLTVPRPDAVRVTRRRTRAAGATRAGPARRCPQRGERRKLMQLATRNAEEMLAREQARWLADQGKTLGALEELADALGLPGLPARIECYDVSNFQGSETVASMVVFEDGKPRTGEYRRFRVRTVEGPNDVASHREVLRRRFRGARPGDEGSAEERRWAMPDLVLIDGGKPQVGAAKGVLDELGLHDLPLAGIAKEREELFLPDQSEPIVLPPTSQALYLVQRIRDEAHRFAITYHRDLRRKASVRSKFDDLPGVGPRRRGALLRVFGSMKRVREAPVEQIAAVPGIGRALAAKDQGGPGGVTPSVADPRLAPVSSALVRRTGPILIAVIGLLALVLDFWPNLYIPTLQQGEAARKVETKLGLDLQGGLKVEYRVNPNGDQNADARRRRRGQGDHRAARERHRRVRAGRRDLGHRPDRGRGAGHQRHRGDPPPRRPDRVPRVRARSRRR